MKLGCSLPCRTDKWLPELWTKHEGVLGVDETLRHSGDGDDTDLHMFIFFPRAVHQKGKKGQAHGIILWKIKVKKWKRKDWLGSIIGRRNVKNT